MSTTGGTRRDDQAARRAGRDPQEVPAAVTDSGREVRRGEDKPGVTNLIDIMSAVTGNRRRRSKRSTATPATASSRPTSARQWSRLSSRSRSAIASSAATRPSCCDCSRSVPRRRARRPRRRSRRCTEHMGFVRLTVTLGSDRAPAASRARRRRRRAALRRRVADGRVHRDRRRARRPRMADRRSDRVGRRTLRPGGDRRAAVDARQPAGALHRAVLAAAGQIVVAQTSILGSLFANALLVLGLAIVAGSRAAPDGVMRFRHRLPNDTATLLLLSLFAIALLGISDRAGDRASHHPMAISVVGAIACWSSTSSGSGATSARTPVRGGARGADHGVLPFGSRSARSAVAGVAAAFVSDWFVDAIDPAVQGARHLEGVHRDRHRRHRRKRRRERRRDHARREGQGRPRGLDRQELGRADRVLPLPRARPALAPLRRTG